MPITVSYFSFHCWIIMHIRSVNPMYPAWFPASSSIIQGEGLLTDIAATWQERYGIIVSQQ